jgi:hypothetical protein
MQESLPHRRWRVHRNRSEGGSGGDHSREAQDAVAAKTACLILHAVPDSN